MAAQIWIFRGGGVELYRCDVVSPRARLACEKCGRAGQYKKESLIARYGADIRLPDLRWEISQCSRQGQMHDACMVRYVDLLPRA